MGALFLAENRPSTLLRRFARPEGVASIEDGEHWVGQTLVPWHISIGTLLFVLVLLRMLWAASQRHQRPRQDPSTQFLVTAGHVLMYLAMALLPITGILTMLGKGYGWTVFGVQLAAKGDEIPWMIAAGSLHSPIAWALVLMIVAHIGMALVHHFVKKDEVLQRML